MELAAKMLKPASRQNEPQLLGQLRELIRRKHYNIRTEEAYCDWIKRFILFHGKRHPVEMAEPEITTFLTHLAVKSNVAAATQNQHVKASLTCRERLQEQQHVLHLRNFARKQTRVFTSATRITFVFG